MPHLELFGSSQCPYTRDLREWLEWTRRDFREYNVDTDPEAYARLQSYTGSSAVPVLVEDGKVTQIGWQGRSCVTGSPGEHRGF
jgi:glutaredoxin 3